MDESNSNTHTNSGILESQFCKSCSMILDLTQPKLPVLCKACGHPIDASDIVGKVKKYSYVFTPWNFYSGTKKSKGKENPDENVGIMDQTRECSNCSHRGMSYTTMQLRSADEGQTIFYVCNKCKHREVENS